MSNTNGPIDKAYIVKEDDTGVSRHKKEGNGEFPKSKIFILDKKNLKFD